jgi:hypothetical protein
MNALSRRVLSQAATLAVATLLLLLLVSHTAQAAVWNLGGVTDLVAQTAAVEGEGTAASPYKIATEADLALIREHPAADFELTANIAMVAPWVPVPTFSGVLDGAGHTIDGITLEPAVEGAEKWTAFLSTNTGTVERLGFVNPTSIVSAKAEENKNRAGVIVLVNKGTMREDWTEGAVIEGGWRGAPIATMNEATVTDCYSVNTKVVAGSEAGGLVGWTSATGLISDSYVAGANVTSNTNAAIFNGYGYAGTKVASDVIYSGSLSNTGANQGRIVARENGTPTYYNNLSLNTATINGSVVTGGTLTNKQGKDTTEAELKAEATYAAIGWNFQNVWTWDATLERPVLRASVEAEGGQTSAPATYTISSEAELALLREHPDASFELTADITMTHPWAPIAVFDGTLDGNGHTISDLEVEGTASKAFIVENTGTIEALGFDAPKSIVTVSNPAVSSSYTESTRVAVIAVINAGRIERVYTKDADVEGGWRTATFAAMNEGAVVDSYAIGSKVVSNWETGALVGWNFSNAVVKDDYVAGVEVTAVSNNGGIFGGYGYGATAPVAATRYEGDVVYSGSLTIPSTGAINKGRIDGQEKNGSPAFVHNLASTAATINGEAVTGGTATNKNGQDATEAELKAEATYTGIGWDFTDTWAWSTAMERPVLRGIQEARTAAEEETETPGGEEEETTPPPVPTQIATEADLEGLREHPEAEFELTADITMTKPWTPIAKFTGTLDGNGHTISGLEVEGGSSQAFFIENTGTIEKLGFDEASSKVTGAFAESKRAAIVTSINTGTIERVYAKNVEIEGGWRGAPIADNNEGTVTDSYTVNSRVVANWESGGLVAWTSAAGQITNSYVAGSDVTALVSSGGILAGYGFTGTKLAGDVVYSGSLVDPNATNRGRILARENGTPTYEDNLSLDTATINGEVVTGGSATNKNGADTTEAELKEESTYTGIGWDFAGVWAWDAALGRPVLQGVAEAAESTEVPGEGETIEGEGTAASPYKIATEADLEQVARHPAADFELTADITVTKPWAPVPLFSGVLDGGGHTITGLVVEGSVEGSASKAFIGTSIGTIKDIGFEELTSITTAPFVEANRIGGVVVINTGTIERVYMKDADVEGGWRTAPIAAMNEGTIADSYTVDSKVVSNWESGAIDGWNSTGSVVKDDYVVGANVDTIASNGGIIGGYGFVAEGGKAATLYEGDVVYSGALAIPAGKPQGRIDGQEHNGSPSYVNNLALNTSTVGGAVVSGGAANNKNGKDATVAELRQQPTYEGIGWDFGTVWEWSAALHRPVLQGLAELGEPPAPEAPVITVKKSTLTYQVGASPSEAQLLAAAEATTDVGAPTIDAGAVNFHLAGEYTAEVEAENEGVDATPVSVTIEVVPVTMIRVARQSASFAASATTPITAAEVIDGVGASATNEATVTADISAVRSDVPGSYQVTLAATDPFGFAVAPLTVTVEVTAAATRTSLVASGTTQPYGTATPVTLAAMVEGGDGAPMGTIGLFDGSTEIAVAPVEAGEAHFTLSGTLAAGDHSLTARFVPVGAANAGSESSPVSVTVTQVVTTTPEGGTSNPSNSPSSSSATPPTSALPTTTTKLAKSTKASKEGTKTTVKIVKGKRPELTIKVTAGSGKVDGQVKVYVDSQVVKTVTVKNGTAQLAIALKPGTHKVKVVFPGDSSLKPSTSATLKVTVKP